MKSIKTGFILPKHYAYKEDTKKLVDIFNRTVKPVVGKCNLSTHLCFGNFKGRPVGYRSIKPMLPDFLDMTVDDVAILPINGNKPERKVAGNLNCREAAELGKTINAKMVIPCHYNLFNFNTADVNDFVKEAEKINQPYTVLKEGEKFSSA